jgi:hypothetical protein
MVVFICVDRLDHAARYAVTFFTQHAAVRGIPVFVFAGEGRRGLLTPTVFAGFAAVAEYAVVTVRIVLTGWALWATGFSACAGSSAWAGGSA